jgi:hypothetical protein
MHERARALVATVGAHVEPATASAWRASSTDLTTCTATLKYVRLVPFRRSSGHNEHYVYRSVSL